MAIGLLSNETDQTIIVLCVTFFFVLTRSVVRLGELKICFLLAYAYIGSELNELQNTS